MKGKLLLGLVITLALLVITFVAVWACTKPSQPQCPPGTIEVMPAVWTEGECSCPTDLVFNGWYWQGWHLRYFTVTFDYGKSNDPNKCHRPTASSLNIPSSLRNEFNREFDEWVNASCTDGYWTDPVCRAPVVTHDVDCEGVRELSEGVFVKYVFHWQYAYILETTVVNDIQYNEPVECLQDMPEGCTTQ